MALLLNLLLLLISGLIYKSDTYEVKSAPLLVTRPSWLKMCHRSDPELNECLTDLFHTIFPELAKGIPAMNVEHFEPLILDRVSISKGSGPVTLAGTLSNLTVTGPSKAIPTYVLLDFDKNTLNFGIYLPMLDIKSDYDLNGKILVLPLIGNGGCEIKLYGVQTMITTNVSFINVMEKREILHIDKMNVAFKLDNMKVNFNNLFNGNKVLGLTVNTFLNQHALDVIGELHDNIGDSLATIFKSLINNVFDKMPTDLWLPKHDDEESTTITVKPTTNPNVLTEEKQTEIKHQ